MTSSSRKTLDARRNNYYALGFGSNYFGALGEIRPAPDHQVAAAVPVVGVASTSSKVGAENGEASSAAITSASAAIGDGRVQAVEGGDGEEQRRYDWGHVHFLSLGNDNDGAAATGSSGTGVKMIDGASSSKHPATDGASPSRAKAKTSKVKASGKSSKGRRGLRKGFLLVGSQKKRKDKKKDGADDLGGPPNNMPKKNDESVPAAGVAEAKEQVSGDAEQDEVTIEQNQSLPESNDTAHNTSAAKAASGSGQQHEDDDGNDAHSTNHHQQLRLLPSPLNYPPPSLIAAGSTFTVCVSQSIDNGGKQTIFQTGTMHGIATGRRYVPKPVRMPLKCLQLACGRRHVVALLGDGPRIGDIREGLGTLFDGPITPMKSRAEVSATAAVGGAGTGTDHDTNHDRDVDILSPIRAAFEALTSGVVMTWGAGHFGQLGHGNEVTNCSEPTIVEKLLPRYVGGPVIHVSAGVLNSAAIVAKSSSSTRAFLFGANRRGQCGTEAGACNAVPYPTPLEDVSHPETGLSVSFVRVSLGRLHGVGLSESGEVYTWGTGTRGRLGHGDSVSAGAAKLGKGIRTPRRIEALKNVTIIQVSAGDGHTLCLTGSGRVFAFGANSEGQLGQGHTVHLLSPRLVGDLDFAGIHSTYDCDGKLLPRRRSSENFAAASVESGGGELQSSVNSLPSDKREDHAAVDGMVTGQDDLPPALPSYLTSSGAMEAFRNSTAEEVPPQPPKIVFIAVAGDYSTALSSSGDLYTWGYGDGCHIGHAVPPTSANLQYVEPGPTSSRTGAGHRIRDSFSFDSRLNILLPRRVECTREMGLRVEKPCLGSGNMILLCSQRMLKNERKDTVGLTLYEIETRRRAQGLSKLRLLSSARKKHHTEGTRKGGSAHAVVPIVEIATATSGKESKPPPTNNAADGRPPTGRHSGTVEHAHQDIDATAQSQSSTNIEQSAAAQNSREGEQAASRSERKSGRTGVSFLKKKMFGKRR